METMIEKIIRLRNEYNVTQQQLSALSEISCRQLRRYEYGEVELKEDVAEKLLATLELVNPNKPLTMIFDYVRIRFETENVVKVIEKYLKIKFDYFGSENYGFYGYNKTYYLGDIVLMTSTKKGLGVLLELKGKGCRQFEGYLYAQERTWWAFFQQVLIDDNQTVIKRLDLAINDKTGILNISELINKRKTGECETIFKSFKAYASGRDIREKEEHKTEMGQTLYLGSKKSDIHFCIYEKDYEQSVKEGLPIEDVEIKNRFEIRLREDRAYKAMIDLLTYQNVESTIFSIINRYVRFTVRDDKKEKEEWLTDPKWEYFIGTHAEKLKLTSEPQKYTLDKSIRWIDKQVARTVKMLQEIDNYEGTSIIEDIFKNAELNRKQEQIIKQRTTPIEEMVC